MSILKHFMRYFILFLILITCSYLLEAQPVLVREISGYSQSPPLAQFNNPVAIAVDKNSNVYVVDSELGTIQKFNSNGEFLLRWGGKGPNVYGLDTGLFITPIAIAVDDSGHVFVADQANFIIQKFDSDGDFLMGWDYDQRYWCTPSDGQEGIAVDEYSNVYVSYGNGCIMKYNSIGQGLNPNFDVPSSLYASYYFGMAVGKNNNVFALTGSDYIQKFNLSSGIDSSFNTIGGNPTSITIDKSGKIFTTNINNVQIYDESGNSLSKWGTTGSGINQFSHLYGIAVDDSGNVFVIDRGNNFFIKKFNSSGTFLTAWGNSGTGNGQLNFPMDMVFDKSYNLFVIDQNNHRIQKYNNLGHYITQWGSYGSGQGQFTFPNGIAKDNLENIYVSDQSGRIQKFNSSGKFINSWGSNGSGQGQFNSLSDISIDKFGKIYAADYGNGRIQKFDTAGNYIAQWNSQDPGNIEASILGNIYVTNLYVNSIEQYDTVGNQNQTNYWYVYDGLTDVSGSGSEIVLSDSYYNRIQFFNSYGGYPFGQIGSSGSGNVQFSFPKKVLFDNKGLIYVCDAGNNRIQVIYNFYQPVIFSFNPDSGGIGTKVSLKGQGLFSVSGVKFDGISAQFSNPSPDSLIITIPEGANSGYFTFSTPAGEADGCCHTFKVTSQIVTSTSTVQLNDGNQYLTQIGKTLQVKNGDGNSRIHVNDIVGRNYYEGNMPNDKLELDIPNGVYIVLISNTKGILRQKILIR